MCIWRMGFPVFTCTMILLGLLLVAVMVGWVPASSCTLTGMRRALAIGMVGTTLGWPFRLRSSKTGVPKANPRGQERASASRSLVKREQRFMKNSGGGANATIAG